MQSLNATIIAVKKLASVIFKQCSHVFGESKRKRSLLFSPLQKEMKMPVVDIYLKNLETLLT